MKKIILIMALLIIVSSANAIFGGESETIYEGDCKISYVNITGSEEIVDNEFTLSNNCIFDSKWIYNCTCDEPIVFTPAVNAVNTYFISTDIWKEREETTPETTSSGGSRSHNYENQDKIIKAVPKVEVEEEVTEEPIDTQSVDELPTHTIVEEKEIHWDIIGLVTLLIIALGIGGYFLLKKQE